MGLVNPEANIKSGRLSAFEKLAKILPNVSIPTKYDYFCSDMDPALLSKIHYVKKSCNEDPGKPCFI